MMPIFTAMTTAGPVRGVSSGIPTTVVYRGIPFAYGPRFAPPLPPEPWKEELLCDTFAPILPQEQVTDLHEQMPQLAFAAFFTKEFYPVHKEVAENPLTLSLWTPAMTTEDRLPVMVWIHGGGMSAGYDSEMEFDGEALSKRGVILVSINYRLDFWGHFSHPELSAKSEHGVSGNWSILDQQAALHWVHDNMKAFGGDPDNVTIFGQSAGGGSVVSHLCSPLSRGLFHHAIIQSGSGTISFTRGLNAEIMEAWGQKVCELSGKSLNELLELPVSELQNVVASAIRKGAGPCPKQYVDGYVFEGQLSELVGTGKIADVDIMVGAVGGDNGLFHGDETLEYHERFARFRYGDRAEDFMREFPPASCHDAYTMLDEKGAQYQDTAICEARIRAGHPAFLYFFHPEIPDGDEFHFIPDGTAYHSSELWYMFGTLNRCWRHFDGRHYDLSDLMMNYWTNFAKTGDPNGTGLPCWPAYSESRKYSMDFTEKKSEALPVPELLSKIAAF